jgi:hypothetical protein
VQFARLPSAPRKEDLARAERDYAEAVQILEALAAAGEIQGTDVTTLENARKELARIRTDLARER